MLLVHDSRASGREFECPFMMRRQETHRRAVVRLCPELLEGGSVHLAPARVITGHCGLWHLLAIPQSLEALAVVGDLVDVRAGDDAVRIPEGVQHVVVVLGTSDARPITPALVANLKEGFEVVLTSGTHRRVQGVDIFVRRGLRLVEVHESRTQTREVATDRNVEIA